ncbi:hypothetical protein ACS0TY_018727 [Phlomoides rotata]
MSMATMDSSWWVFTLLAILGSKIVLDEYLIVSIFLVFLSLAIVTWAFTPGGSAWKNSFGSTPVVVASDVQTAKEILTSPDFADRPIKQSARSLMFSRAIGFSPNGVYWRLLRRIASSYLFSPRRIAGYEAGRQEVCIAMLRNIEHEQSINGFVTLRKHLQAASLDNIMGSVFGKHYDAVADDVELNELEEMLVKSIIDEHRVKNESQNVTDATDFVDVLLSLDGEEKLSEDDMVAFLWRNRPYSIANRVGDGRVGSPPGGAIKAPLEIDGAAGLSDAHMAALPYLQVVVKETLRIHPPGPLLSWARLSTSDVSLSNGMVVPAGTTAMVNMWSITHDPAVWEKPLEFRPERFVEEMGGVDVDVRGSDLRLVPFGAGRRVCPGTNLGMATVSLWVAKLVRHYEWAEDGKKGVDLSERLKLSCEMKYPLSAIAKERNVAY